MNLVFELSWPVIILALVLFSDVLLSFRPPKFIRDCLDGVNFPRDWWWVLIVVKMLAIVGLIVGLWAPDVALAANAGVIVYFSCAVVAHIRAQFFGRIFWINCVGMLILSVMVFGVSFLL